MLFKRESFMLQLKPHFVRAEHEQDDTQNNSSSFWTVLLFGICWGRSRLDVSPEEIMPWTTSVWLKSVIRVVQQGMYTPSGGVVFRIKRYSHGLFLDTAALWSCTVFGTLSHWGSWGLGDAADTNLELHVALHFLLHPPHCPVTGCARCTMSPITDGAWPDFSPLIATAKKSATESSRVACIINRRREGFFFIPARVKCQWEISTRCTLTLGDHCAYWHSPHRGVESDRLRLRRFIHAPTDTWQRQMISTSSVNSRSPCFVLQETQTRA